MSCPMPPCSAHDADATGDARNLATEWTHQAHTQDVADRVYGRPHGVGAPCGPIGASPTPVEDGPHDDTRRPVVEIHYGWKAGARTLVSIRLIPADVPVMFAYAARWSAHIQELIIVWARDRDGDGGELLSVPRVSAAEFAAMPTTGRVV
jgi:hypothetical protein